MKQWPIYLFILLFSGACQQGPVFSEYHALADETWQQDQVLEFNAKIPDSGQYQISVQVRYTYALETKNIWCIVNTRNTASQQLHDTINLQLAEDDGFRYGKGGHLKTIEQPITKNPVTLPQGNTLFRLEQGLPIDIKGIKDAGICIRKSNTNE